MKREESTYLLRLEKSKFLEMQAQAKAKGMTFKNYLLRNHKIDKQNTMNETTYYFKYKNEKGTYWYKTSSDLREENLLVTVIDPMCHEYETIFLRIEDKSDILFYKDFLEFLRKEDSECWKNQTSDLRFAYEMRYLRHLHPENKEYKEYFMNWGNK